MSAIEGDETIQARRQRLSTVPRACEGCKIRKIRCDRTNPCSNCRTAGIVCQVKTPTGESRSKVDKVTQLEEHIERLEQRICILEHQHLGRGSASESSVTTNEQFASPRTSAATPYEGDSSFISQSRQASELTQSMTSGSASLDPSFGELRTLLQPSSAPSYLDDYQFSRKNDSRLIPTMRLPPADLVIVILQRVKMNTPVFLYGLSKAGTDFVERLCRKVYFPIEPPSPGHVAAMLGILCNCFKEFIATSDPLLEKYDLKTHLEICEQSFKVGIETFDVLAVPSLENILALTLGAMRAQLEAKPMLLCTLISAAISQCRMIGYQREITYQNDHTGNSDIARLLFWTIYVTDKTMSLLLGRASSLQDFEIDARYPAVSNDPTRHPWDKSFIMGIKIARIQGQIYDRLYSPAALALPSFERIQRMTDLTIALKSWFEEKDQIDISRARYADTFESIARPYWEITYYSTLTMLLRTSSIPGTGSEISSQCFQAARLALKAHINCFSNFHDSSVISAKDYATYIHHNSSFTPFVVIFLHAIAASSLDDVELLDDVVKALQAFRGISKHTERLYNICATLTRLARRLAESGNAHLGAYNMQENSLQFLEDTDQIMNFQPESLENLFDTDLMDQFTESSREDVSAVLGSWASGQPSASLLGTEVVFQ
ncbi:hypothetical protein CC78DRAFT_536366 [Lojkania enalia]|uniref:Zn(2)-C6 fungal-type domain-containing protein n=1 Tax=Lojkania enalia TaxID=147567 RepID=A0A9P4N386_9PLEO|nr:hypothetical protein CC78DRAFT_536366 [Didymosphaeria enalia]